MAESQVTDTFGEIFKASDALTNIVSMVTLTNFTFKLTNTLSYIVTNGMSEFQCVLSTFSFLLTQLRDAKSNLTSERRVLFYPAFFICFANYE